MRKSKHDPNLPESPEVTQQLDDLFRTGIPLGHPSLLGDQDIKDAEKQARKTDAMLRARRKQQ